MEDAPNALKLLRATKEEALMNFEAPTRHWLHLLLMSEFCLDISPDAILPMMHVM
jgi:hypothetical protein